MGLGCPWKGHLTPGWRQLSAQGWVYAALGMGGLIPSTEQEETRIIYLHLSFGILSDI